LVWRIDAMSSRLRRYFDEGRPIDTQTKKELDTERYVKSEMAGRAR